MSESLPPPAAPPPAAPPPSGVSPNRQVMIVLSYIGLLALIPLLSEKEDREVQWHAKHGLVLFVSWIVLMVATLFTGLYPRVMVSSTDFADSLTVESASSSRYALQVMTVAALILAPVVLLYQGWTYHVFRGRLGMEAEAGSPVDLVAKKTGGG